MQHLHNLGCDWTDGGHMFLHQGAYMLINSKDPVINELHLQTNRNIERHTHSIVTIPKGRTVTSTSSTTCVFKLHLNKTLITPKPHLVMLPAIHLKNLIKLDNVPVTFVTLFSVQVQLTKHILVGSLQLYTKHQDRQDIPVKETNQIYIKKGK